MTQPNVSPEQPALAYRPPRIQPELPFNQVEIPKPPDPTPEGYARLIQVGLPLITIVGYVLVSTLGGTNRNPLLVVPMALSVIASAIMSFYSYRKEQQRRAETEQAYSNRLTELNKELLVAHDMQRRFYHYNYPDSATIMAIVAQSLREAQQPTEALRKEARLWERRPGDHDFGVLRLGIGTLPSTVTYKLAGQAGPESPLIRAASKLEIDSHYVNNIPVILSLRQPPEPHSDREKAIAEAMPTPVAHALAVAGESSVVRGFARTLISQYAVLHTPSDARLYLIANSRADWAWVEQLPHTNDGEQGRLIYFDQESRRIVVGPDDDGTARDRFMEGLRKVLSQRKIRLQERSEDQQDQANATMPQILVIVDLLDPTIAGVETDGALSILIDEGRLLGAAVIFLVPERSQVPSGCQAVIEIERTTLASNRKIQEQQQLHFRYAEVGVNTLRYVGVADEITAVQQPELDHMAKNLAGLMIRQGAGSSLPSSVEFFDLMGYTSMAALRQHTASAWARAAQPRHAGWLKVPIGKMPGDKPRMLRFSAKQDGVHGMVAGSTGSGKSELLISLIIGLATRYDPTTLNFVLVDYKGGSAFDEFRKLPHCVDIVTNLAGEGVTRMFTAIDAEIKRRQALNVRTGTKDIVEYRKAGLHIADPYPFLFIIIDEFAEMIADRAEFRAQLESIARIGRAQGISLILAAQRPSGVTDQMRSNIKFRICLRVETAPESREMLRRTDAAFLPPGMPGRGYIQVGNEEIELIQVAYTGEPYIDLNRPKQAAVIWPALGDTYDPAQDQAPPPLYEIIISALDDLAQAQSVQTQLAPWPKPLPNQLLLSQALITDDPHVPALTAKRYLDSAALHMISFGNEREQTFALNSAIDRWLTGAGSWNATQDWQNLALRPVIGLIDNPYAGKQHPLTMALVAGHIAVFGASGAGKTTLVQSLVVSLTATHSPRHVHLYLLDLGGQTLSVFDKLPHVGAVISPNADGYEERVEQLIRELETMVVERKKILGDARVNTLADLYQRNPGTDLPAVIVIIDDAVEFVETFGGQQEERETVLDRLVMVARQSVPFGIHLVVTAKRPGELPSQLANVLTERMTLRLSDSADYRTALGTATPDVPEIPGRGYLKIGSQALAFQVGLAFKNQDLIKESNDLDTFIAALRIGAQKLANLAPPIRIDALGDSILLRDLLTKQAGIEATATNPIGRLREAIDRAWMASTAAEHADWLKATIGRASGNRTRVLTFEASKDGVHGLIAGGTGSGKSELLMSLIVSLALTYDPSVLNFVLIDYKGGGAFKPFEQLPHCVESISNLNESAVRRLFDALTAELERRQRLLGNDDIVTYRKNDMHWQEPLPFLFIIIDEYAEMISLNPSFRDQLERVARVGRSLGVHMILAAQRPIGVTDQMRANIQLRICLRVVDSETSREMLRRSDAAFLPRIPGRGFIQVGNDSIQLIQTAYAGEAVETEPLKADGKPPKFFDVAVRLTNALLSNERPLAPWPPALPPTLALGAPVREEYLDPQTHDLLMLGQSDAPCLNPYVSEWLRQRDTWPDLRWAEQGLQAVAGLIDDPFTGRQRALAINFNRGNAVLFGASGWGKTSFVRTVAASLAATHRPDQLHMHVIDLGGTSLQALSHLPHIGTIIVPDERGYGYEELLQQFWRELSATIEQRQQAFKRVQADTLADYNLRNPQVALPAMLILIDNLPELLDSLGPGAKNREQAESIFETMVSIMRQGRAYGVHFLATANRLNVLPSKIYSLFTERYALRLADPDEYGAIVGAQIGTPDDIPGRGYTRVGGRALSFQIATLPTMPADAQFVVDNTADGAIAAQPPSVLELLGQRQRLVYRAAEDAPPLIAIGALDNIVSYRTLVAQLHTINQTSAHFLDDLAGRMRSNWAHNRGAGDAADWLRVTVGMGTGNRPRELRLEAKRDGVHSLIAGGTGSGKSELLTTLITGLVINYPPDILNLVLVDFKGGGAFQPFATLPHCVDIVTNLNTAAVHRMFTSIGAEIRRRQELNKRTRTKDIIEYRKNGLHLTGEAYPHLFIIIDEYAEMIDQNPEYRQQLESITRVGRAQGINLLLASQRPKGVSDQMRANIKLRICLRVEDQETSRELLRRPDAALLPSGMPGRGYLQSGNDSIELMQMAWAGESQPTQRVAHATWADDRADQLPPATDDDQPKFFDAVVQLATELWGDQPLRRPWPPFLPPQISLEQAGIHHGLVPLVTNWLNGDDQQLWQHPDWLAQALHPVVGLADHPEQATQYPLRLDFGRGHLAIFGDVGSGRTTLLRTLAISMAAHCSASQLHIYAVDMSGNSFRTIRDLPHIAQSGIIEVSDPKFEERFQRLLSRLNGIVDQRLEQFGARGLPNLAAYNQAMAHAPLPLVLVLIDNAVELLGSYEQLISNVLVPLVRRCLAVGVVFAVSTNLPNQLGSQLYGALTERLTFRQSKFDSYLDIVGRVATDLEPLPGRGYMAIDRQPRQFQAAHPLGIIGFIGHEHEADALRQLCTRMRTMQQARHLPGPAALEILPDRIALQRMLDESPPPRSNQIAGVIGQSEQLTPALIDLGRLGPHFMIAGPPLSGKTTAMLSWMLGLAERYTPQQLAMVLIDPQRRLFEYGGQSQLLELPHVLRVVSETDELRQLVEQLDQEFRTIPARPIMVFIDNFDELNDEIEKPNYRSTISEPLAALARRAGRSGLHLVIAGTFDGAGISDLRRRIQSSGYGLALQTEQALTTLRVQRTPAVLRGGPLTNGRGFLVKAGQPSLVQVAELQNQPPATQGIEEQEQASRNALDAWVATIILKHGRTRALWGSGGEDATAVVGPTDRQRKQATEMAMLIRRAMRVDLEQLRSGTTAGRILEATASLDSAAWSDLAQLQSVLALAVIELKVAMGEPRSVIEQMVAAMADDIDSLIYIMRGTLS